MVLYATARQIVSMRFRQGRETRE